MAAMAAMWPFLVASGLIRLNLSFDSVNPLTITFTWVQAR